MKRALAITLILLASACEEPIPKCVPGATVECPCPGRAPGYQVCAPLGVFSSCQCSSHEAQPDDPVTGFWCAREPVGPNRLVECSEDRERCKLVTEVECVWQDRAYCYQRVWGPQCYSTMEQCQEWQALMRNVTAQPGFPHKDTNEPITDCRIFEYLW
jgi:hypothetical protein